MMVYFLRVLFSPVEPAHLPGIRNLASKVLGLPVRIAQPENITGMVDQLKNPAFSTSVGLLYWAAALTGDGLKSVRTPDVTGHGLPPVNFDSMKEFLKRLLP